ncbi:unnamed protein product [Ectocarpus sp. 12 AP-2014]
MLFAKATIARAVEAALPNGMTATDEMVEAINKSCAEFVNLLSTEASAKAKGSGKNPVMSNEDVVEAIKRLGLEAYLTGAEEGAAADSEKEQARRKRKRKPKQSKEAEEAAANKQRELLEATAKSFYEDQGLA